MSILNKPYPELLFVLLEFYLQVSLFTNSHGREGSRFVPWRKPLLEFWLWTANFSLNLSQPCLPKSVKTNKSCKILCDVRHLTGLTMIRKVVFKCFVNYKIQKKKNLKGSVIIPICSRACHPQCVFRRTYGITTQRVMMHSHFSISKIIINLFMAPVVGASHFQNKLLLPPPRRCLNIK